ncbi:hypothetical protein KM043_010059 [Ampulex compressa]|nr:hypothetical protein KM043_010059 [Ampulex compressa]
MVKGGEWSRFNPCGAESPSFWLASTEVQCQADVLEAWKKLSSGRGGRGGAAKGRHKGEGSQSGSCPVSTLEPSAVSMTEPGLDALDESILCLLVYLHSDKELKGGHLESWRLDILAHLLENAFDWRLAQEEKEEEEEEEEEEVGFAGEDTQGNPRGSVYLPRRI